MTLVSSTGVPISNGMGRPPTLFVLVGQRIGRGVVLDNAVRVQVSAAVPQGRRGARLRCDCGAEYEAALLSLVERRGRINTTSCGCAQREAAAHTGTSTIRQAHAGWVASRGQAGLTSERRTEYARWRNMMARCYDPQTHNYQYWGGRGIRVYESWHDFRTWLADMDRLLGPCPDGWTIDRKDPDKNYEPGNVRWADYFTQNNNLRGRRELVAS